MVRWSSQLISLDKTCAVSILDCPTCSEDIDMKCRDIRQRAIFLDLELNQHRSQACGWRLAECSTWHLWKNHSFPFSQLRQRLYPSKLELLEATLLNGIPNNAKVGNYRRGTDLQSERHAFEIKFCCFYFYMTLSKSLNLSISFHIYEIYTKRGAIPSQRMK